MGKDVVDAHGNEVNPDGFVFVGSTEFHVHVCSGTSASMNAEHECSRLWYVHEWKDKTATRRWVEVTPYIVY